MVTPMVETGNPGQGDPLSLIDRAVEGDQARRPESLVG